MFVENRVVCVWMAVSENANCSSLPVGGVWVFNEQPVRYMSVVAQILCFKVVTMYHS